MGELSFNSDPWKILSYENIYDLKININCYYLLGAAMAPECPALIFLDDMHGPILNF